MAQQCPKCIWSPGYTGTLCLQCLVEERTALRAQVAELERDNAEHALILEQQDRTLTRYREALERIVDDPDAAHYAIAFETLNPPDPNPPENAAYWKRRAAKAEARVADHECQISRMSETLRQRNARVTELEARLFRMGAMVDAPCFACGYDGPGYFNPAVHPCAVRHQFAGIPTPGQPSRNA